MPLVTGIWGTHKSVAVLASGLLHVTFILAVANCLQRHSVVGASVSDGGLKYAHGPLVSSLSGGARRAPHEYGPGGERSGGTATTLTGNDDSSAGFELAENGLIAGSSMRGNGRGSRADVGAASSRADSDEPSVSGGEVLAPKAFPMSPQEPTCEQLRAMWIFSKRQSRAAEITNEIPTYRDPFTYNVWEPYYSTTRGMGTVRMLPRYGEHSHSPVFGRVLNREPLVPQRMLLGGPPQRLRLGEGHSVGPMRLYSPEGKQHNTGQRQRPASQYRLLGANGASGPTSNAVAPVQGSFQKLKELIWTERAKELTQQRRAEELAARAAVLKEIANGQNIHLSSYKHPFKPESSLTDENRSPDREEHMNDGRMSTIASGQSQTLNAHRNAHNKHSNNNNKNAMRSSTRSYATGRSHSGGHKPVIFASNTGRSENSNDERAGYTAWSNMMSGSGYPLDAHDAEQGDSSGGGVVTGIPKVHPIRSSHFRERNRAIFKQNSPMDYFQREIRHQNYDDLLMEHIISSLGLLQKHQSQQPVNWAADTEEDTSGDVDLDQAFDGYELPGGRSVSQAMTGDGREAAGLDNLIGDSFNYPAGAGRAESMPRVGVAAYNYWKPMLNAPELLPDYSNY